MYREPKFISGHLISNDSEKKIFYRETSCLRFLSREIVQRKGSHLLFGKKLEQASEFQRKPAWTVVLSFFEDSGISSLIENQTHKKMSQNVF